jgi:imidazolonepropionase-like amidohydrolase
LILLAILLGVGAAHSAERTALVGGTLIDGTLREPLRNSVILIEGERITAVGRWARSPFPLTRSGSPLKA